MNFNIFVLCCLLFRKVWQAASSLCVLLNRKISFATKLLKAEEQNFISYNFWQSFFFLHVFLVMLIIIGDFAINKSCFRSMARCIEKKNEITIKCLHSGPISKLHIFILCSNVDLCFLRVIRSSSELKMTL